MKLMKIVLLAASSAAILLASCTSPDGRLASLARERMALAPEVARYKHSRGLPIRDIQREEELLKSVAKAAAAEQLNPKTVQSFFADEMEFSRRIQEAWINIWKKHPPSETRPPLDLSSDLRPRIDKINAGQIQALAAGATPLNRDQLSSASARFFPKNCRSRVPDSSPSTPPVTTQR